MILVKMCVDLVPKSDAYAPGKLAAQGTTDTRAFLSPHQLVCRKV